jgi:hypothetical protein
MPNGVEVVVQIVISKANVAALARRCPHELIDGIGVPVRITDAIFYRSLGEIERTFFYWRQSF